MACQTLVSGIGASIKYSPLPTGVCEEPVLGTFEVITSASAKNATSITTELTTAEAGKRIRFPKGGVMVFTTPTGNFVPVTLAADVDATTDAVAPDYTVNVTLTVLGNHLEIPVGSTATNIQTLGARTSITVSVSVSDEKVTLLDGSGFWSAGKPLAGEATANCEGLFLQQDGALLSVRNMTLGSQDLTGATLNLPGQQGYLWIETAEPSSLYSSGTVFKGEAYATQYEINLDNAIAKQAVPFAFNGQLYIVDPVVI